MAVKFSLWDTFEDRIQKVLPLFSSYSSPVIKIGKDLQSGEDLSLLIEDGNNGLSSTHTYILGSSGVGKSKFTSGLFRNIIDAGYGCLLLDGKNDLYDESVDYLADKDSEELPLSKKTIFIDPNEGDYSVGLNYLELMGDTTPDALANLVVEAFKKFCGSGNEYEAWLEEWLPPSLIPLIEGKFTLLELFHFLNLQDPRFRDAVISRLDTGFYKTKWETLQSFRPHEQALMLNSVRTRASIFWQDKALRAMFGQEKTTIDWLKVMNEGGYVLAKLGRTPRLPERTASLIGAALLHQITTIAPLRRVDERRPFFIICDEFQKFCTPDFADALERLRGFGISFILAHQHRKQFEKTAPEILNSIDANCRNKIIFACSRKDSEDVAVDISTGKIHTGAEETKQETYQTKQRPKKVYEEIVTVSEAQMIGSATMSSFAGGTGVSTMIPDGSGNGAVTNIVTNIESGGTVSTSAHMRGRSVSRVPIIEHEEYLELSSRNQYPQEEVKERFIAEVKNQPDRHAHWKFKSGDVTRFTTHDLVPVVIDDDTRQRFKRSVYAESTKPTREVFESIEKRVPRFLDYVAAKKSQTSTPSSQDPADEELYETIDHESEKSVK